MAVQAVSNAGASVGGNNVALQRDSSESAPIGDKLNAALDAVPEYT